MSHKSQGADRRDRKRSRFSGATPPRPRRNPWTILSIVLSIGFVATIVVLSVTGGQGSEAAPSEITQPGGDVALPVATFNDGVARHYRYTTAGGQQITFFVMRSSDGVVRAAFDACDVCFRSKKGYRQAGDRMLCNNCGKLFPSSDINVVQGGCNPAPLERAVIGDKLVLKAADLAQGVAYF
jgi:uncharacterized membrane protein